MAKSPIINLNELDLDELQAISSNAQQLIEKKQHQRLFDAYRQFEKIANDANSSIEEILDAGKDLEKERSIKYQNPKNPEETWTGRGRKPTWLVEALDAGQSLEDFLR